MKVNEALLSIAKQDLVLPEFQREYVWTKEQAKQLVVSLLRGYPVGGLLIWKTDSPPELKNVAKLPDKLGTVMVLLDGQQRLTTLHMLLTGTIPAYYRPEEIENDPRDLYFNLDTGDLQYYQPTRMKDDPLWQRVVDCFSEHSVNLFQIVQAKGLDGQAAFALAERLNANLTKLRAVRDADLPAQIVPSSASLTDAIDIFDRVNSQGTKLTDAELALTHVTAKWPQARRVMKQKIEECAKRRFDFSLTFMTRALTTTVTRRALFETIHPIDGPAVRAGWERLSKVLDYLTTILPSRAFIHSTDDLNTTNALVPLVAYLEGQGGKFPNDTSIKHAVHWLYAALMWARYTGQTDQRLETDVTLVARETEPWSLLCDQIIDQRGRIEVEAGDFAGRGTPHPLYRAAFILSKAHGAVDWFNGLPLAQTHGNAYGVHSHHIFPQALLYKNGFNVEDYTHRQLVNEIANRAFLTAESNLELSDTEPAAYLPEVEAKYPGALGRQFIPMDPGLWKVTRYRDFLEARRSLIAKKLNEFMRSLVREPDMPHHRPVTELIALGESLTLEFKSSVQWDMVQNRQNTALRVGVLKTIAAFLNTDGGTLVIGVEDRGSICGIEPDLRLLGGSRDKFGQLVSSLVFEHLGAGVTPCVRQRFEEVDGRTVCVVDVDRSSEPVFVKGERGREFYVRVGNTTRALDTEETLRYLESRGSGA
ncbi:MAG TPA: DUF262 domain-containing protein [Vicinamibacterales bacterium]|nr:DUF262 domain-containing protein [Vicinamibacterales bacterium]